jgi:hypothetical protein
MQVSKIKETIVKEDVQYASLIAAAIRVRFAN